MLIEVFTYLKNAITFIFLISILSYYYLLFFVKRKSDGPVLKFKSVSVIVPAHNEEEYIALTLKKIIQAKFDGVKEIIVVDDGSIDKTYQIVSEFKQHINVIKTAHSGKSASINKALEIATGELIAIVDADSYIDQNALVELAHELGKKDIAAATGVIKVHNRKKFLCMWPHIELIYNSLIRDIFSKINANVITPGALSMYRADYLREINGFSTQGYSEDTDVTIRLIRKGHTIAFSNKAISETNMPYTVKSFLRQRVRFAKGLIDILRRHLKLNNAMIDVYTLPLFLFAYFQSVIISLFTIYQLVSGYFVYFANKGMYFNFYVLKFFFEWFSIFGFIRWAFGLFTGATPWTIMTVIGVVSTLMSYPLFIFAIWKYDRKIDIYHIIPILFMFPFWFVMMIIYTLCLPEYFKKKQYNIWKKNER